MNSSELVSFLSARMKEMSICLGSALGFGRCFVWCGNQKPSALSIASAHAASSNPKAKMNEFLLIVNFVLTSAVAGLFGGATMVFVMWLMTRAGLFAGEWEPPPRRNMIVALGGMLTKSRESATRVGLVAHTISAIGFALLYTMAMLWLHQTRFPAALVLGLGIGFFHGLIVSLMLVWVIAEGHPFEEYGEAGLAVGLSHLIGHVAYGAMVGLVVGISPL